MTCNLPLLGHNGGIDNLRLHKVFVSMINKLLSMICTLVNCDDVFLYCTIGWSIHSYVQYPIYKPLLQSFIPKTLHHSWNWVNNCHEYLSLLDENGQKKDGGLVVHLITDCWTYWAPLICSPWHLSWQTEWPWQLTYVWRHNLMS